MILILCFFLILRLPPATTRTETLFPNTTLCRSRGIAIAGGMFVVPLYAFLTTTVAKSQTARTVAANNIVNSGFMVAATLVLSLLIGLGLTIDDTLLMVAAMCLQIGRAHV